MLHLVRRQLPRSSGRSSRTCPIAYFSSSSRYQSYDDTIGNLRIGKHTRVVFQGFTGRQATANAKESLEWGTNIVGGITPGRTGEHLGLPVLPSVREAMEKLKPDATGIYVAAHQAPTAIEEAIEAEVPLIVAVAEHIPIHDIMRIHSMLKTQSKCRLVGANSPGIISAVGQCRIGFQPLPCFMPGRIGIVAKSGTLSYEAVASTTRSGLGQSLCIGMGGDQISGTGFVDALKVFESDPDTDGIVIIGELGGRAEEEAAEWIKDYTSRVKDPKPITALIGGVNAPFGRIMGHAGAFTLPTDTNAVDKIQALEKAGVTMVNHPSRFGEVMKTLLPKSGRPKSGAFPSQRRGLHTLARRVCSRPSLSFTPSQTRRLHIRQGDAFDLLREKGINVGEYSGKGPQGLLTVTIDRSARSPCIIAAPAIDNADIEGLYQNSKKFPFDYRSGPDNALIESVASFLHLDSHTTSSLPKLINSLVDLFISKEAYLLETSFVTRLAELKVTSANFSFDDACFRSSKRQAEIHALRRTEDEVPVELDAEKDGIVYVQLSDPPTGPANIGTLVNGAGLAMNTVDALADAGGAAANFLDTGGKATSETVKKSFELILQDPRVKVIIVNIFGGLTRGDMIAEGVLLAFKELEMNLPVVVRIRGTNEKEGQRIIAESGLPLLAYDDFDEAAAKAIELANAAS